MHGALALPFPLALLFVLLSAPLEGDAAPPPAWPEFRGPHRSGFVADGHFPTRFGPDTNLAWRVPVPPGHSSPITWGSNLFITAFESNRLVTLAFDRHAGATLWRREVAPGRIESGSRLSNPASATPVTDGERVVAYFAPFGLVAYDFDGREVWQAPLPTPVTGHGASSSPVIAGDLVLQLVDQDIDSYLLALDRRTGRQRWRAERPGFRRGFSTPLPFPPNRPDSVIVAGTLRLVAYDLADGSERWSVSGLPNEMVASPIAGPEFIHVAGWTPGSGVPRMPAWTNLLATGDSDHDGRLARDEAPAGPARQHFHYMDADRDGRLDRGEYETIARIFDESRNVALAIRPGGRGDVTESHVAWSQTRGLPYVPVPLLAGDRLYLLRNGGLLSCLDARSGEFRYREERLGALGDNYASPIAGGGRILAISQPGVAVVLRDSDTLEVLARNPIGEEVLATPAIVADTLYLRSARTLWAFRESPSGP